MRCPLLYTLVGSLIRSVETTLPPLATAQPASLASLRAGVGDNLAFFSEHAYADFDATFEFRFQVEGASDFPGPAGFCFGAGANASEPGRFYALEFPAVAQQVGRPLAPRRAAVS